MDICFPLGRPKSETPCFNLNQTLCYFERGMRVTIRIRGHQQVEGHLCILPREPGDRENAPVVTHRNRVVGQTGDFIFPEVSPCPGTRVWGMAIITLLTQSGGCDRDSFRGIKPVELVLERGGWLFVVKAALRNGFDDMLREQDL